MAKHSDKDDISKAEATAKALEKTGKASDKKLAKQIRGALKSRKAESARIAAQQKKAKNYPNYNPNGPN